MPASTPLENILEQQHWLDPAAGAVHSAVGKVVKSRKELEPLKDFLHGKWLGHPLHPALTDVPTGSWTITFITDLAEIFGNKSLSKVGDTALTIGLSGALASAVSGLVDWYETNGEARRIGLVHGVLNFTGVALYSASLALRLSGKRRLARILSMLTYLGVNVSAYLGGELVVRYGIGVDHTAWPLPPEQYVEVMDIADLREGEPKVAMAGEVPVLLVLEDMKVYAIGATCCHQGGPLEEGKYENGEVTCPWHGSMFNVKEGKVLRGPAVFDQPHYDVRIRKGKIEVKLAR